jgi:hypothetical protein
MKGWFAYIPIPKEKDFREEARAAAKSDVEIERNSAEVQ